VPSAIGQIGEKKKSWRNASLAGGFAGRRFFWVFFVFCVGSIDLPNPIDLRPCTNFFLCLRSYEDRAFSATSAKLEEKKYFAGKDGRAAARFYVANSLMFGLTAAVHSVNRVSRSIWWLFNKMLLTPCRVLPFVLLPSLQTARMKV